MKQKVSSVNHTIHLNGLFIKKPQSYKLDVQPVNYFATLLTSTSGMYISYLAA